MARKSTSKFINLAPSERRSAQGLLNGYNRRLRTWERQAAKLPNIAQMGGTVDFSRYIGFSDQVLGRFTTLQQVRHAIDTMNADIKARIDWQREAKKTRDKGKDGLLDGQYVYFAIGYRQGLGAMFMGYVDTKADRYTEVEYDKWQGVDAYWLT